MTTTTALQAIPLPTTPDAPTIPADLLAEANYVEKRLVMRFTDATDRDSKILVPENGMVAYLTTPKIFTFHNGTTWGALLANFVSPVIAAVDSVNSGGQMTLIGAGSNKSWGIKSQAGTLVFRYDFQGTPVDIASLTQTGFVIATGKTFTKDGVVQPTIRTGIDTPLNAVGVDGDIYIRYS
jgi:hypothetical protein